MPADPANIRLTALEIASMWSQYQNNSLASCVLNYLHAKTEDEAICKLLHYARSLSQQQMTYLTQVFQQEGWAIPLAFSDRDVNVSAGRLFGDLFSLHYLSNMSRLGLAAYGLALSNASRVDIRKFYRQSLQDSMELNEKVISLMQEKGIYSRPPFIPPSQIPHIAEKPGFLGNLFKETRPLTVLEIANLFVNIQTNVIGKAVMTAFSQVVSSPEIRDFFLRGKSMAQKHIEIFTEKLAEDDLPGTLPIEPLITDSTKAPFSDRLMLVHTATLIQAGMGNYGLAVSTSQRYDLAGIFVRLMAEVGAFSEDGANLLIQNGWLEEPPQAVDRRKLAMSH